MRALSSLFNAVSYSALSSRNASYGSYRLFEHILNYSLAAVKEYSEVKSESQVFVDPGLEELKLLKFGKYDLKL